MRITATKEKSEAIVQEIQATLRSICSLIIDLNALISGPKGSRNGAESPGEAAYDECLINELAKLTDTHIKRLPNNQVSPTKCEPEISSTDNDWRFPYHASMRDQKHSCPPKPMLSVAFCSPHLI